MAEKNLLRGFTITTPDSYQIKGMFFSPATPPKRQILIVLGRNELPYKYLELYEELNDLGYLVCVYDHRGQGFNEHLTPPPARCHIDSFDTYADDFMQVLNSLDSSIPCSVLAVSMGSLIVLRSIQLHPVSKLIDNVIFVSPFLGLKQPVPHFLIALIAKLKNTLTDIIYHEKNSFFYPHDTFQERIVGINANTHDRNRNEVYYSLYRKFPETRLGGVTANWLLAALKCLKQVNCKDYALDIPALFLIAENDNIVNSNKTLKFIQLLSKNNKQIEYSIIENSLHDILIEEDNFRNEAVKTITEFLARDFSKKS